MNLFNSSFNTTTSSVNPLLLLFALATSLLLGILLTWVYKYRTLYTREFVITLTLLPSLMTLIIFLINGSLGTSIAVAGTFSLIRFRSATSGSRELLAIFLSMIIGLAVGTGYLLLASVTTSLILALWFFLEQSQSKSPTQTRRLLTIAAENTTTMEETIKQVIQKNTQTSHLISLKSNKQGQELTLVYEIDLVLADGDFRLTNDLLQANDKLDVAISTQAKKRKNL